jgi:DhnA family fructose-bisphosphate aldolase class Ia
MSGAEIRTGRLFNPSSGRSFMVAMDRTLSTGPEEFAEDSAELVASIVAGGADAILMSPGLIKRHGGLVAFRGGPALVARIDFPFLGGVAQGTGEEFRLIASVEEAVSLGADAVVVFLIGGLRERRVFAENLAAVGAVAAETRRLGVPLLVEAVPWGDASPSQQDPKLVAQLSRIAVELGADVVKTEFVGSAEAMHAVVEACPVPVLVLGGPRLPIDQLLARTSEALSGGVRGVVFGRNSWQRPDAAEAMKHLRALIHENPAV